MSDRWRRRAPAILVISLSVAAAIVTVVLIRGLWSGYRVSSRTQLVLQRLEPDTQSPQSESETHADESGTPSEGPAAGAPDDPPEVQAGTPLKADPVAQALARIKEKNLFFVPVKPDFRGIIGVLGDRVLYPGGMTLGIGDTHHGATVKVIGSNWVQFEFEGGIVSVGINGGSAPGPSEPESTKKQAIDKNNSHEPENVSVTVEVIKTSHENTGLEIGPGQPVAASKPAASQPSASQPSRQ